MKFENKKTLKLKNFSLNFLNKKYLKFIATRITKYLKNLKK